MFIKFFTKNKLVLWQRKSIKKEEILILKNEN